MNKFPPPSVATLAAKSTGDKIQLRWAWVNETVPKFVRHTEIFYMRNGDSKVYNLGQLKSGLRTEYTVTDVKLDTKYKICLQVLMLTEWPGEKEPAPICADITNSRWEISALVGSIIGALLALLLIVMVLLLTRRVRAGGSGRGNGAGGGGNGRCGQNHKHLFFDQHSHHGNHHNNNTGSGGGGGDSFYGNHSGRRPRFDSTFDSQFDSMALREDTSFYDELLTSELSCDSSSPRPPDGLARPVSGCGGVTVISSTHPLVATAYVPGYGGGGTSCSSNNNAPVTSEEQHAIASGSTSGIGKKKKTSMIEEESTGAFSIENAGTATENNSQTEAATLAESQSHSNRQLRDSPTRLEAAGISLATVVTDFATEIEDVQASRNQQVCATTASPHTSSTTTTSAANATNVTLLSSGDGTKNFLTECEEDL